MKRTSRVGGAGALALLLAVGVGLASLGRLSAQSAQVPQFDVNAIARHFCTPSCRTHFNRHPHDRDRIADIRL